MSRTTLIEFSKSFRKINEIEYCNSWGSLPRIWESLFDKYFREGKWDDYLAHKNANKLVTIYNSDNYPMFERIVMGLTLDYAIIYKKNFLKMAKALEEFEKDYPRKEEYVNHLPAFIEVFKQSKATIIGFHLTSVCEDPWAIPTKERKEKCFDIIDELEGAKCPIERS